MRGEPSTDGNSRVQPRALFLLLSQCEPLWFKNQYKEEALEITALVPVTISIESTLRFRKESGNNERSWQFSIFSRWRIEDGKNSTRRANKNLEYPIIIYHDFNSTSRKGAVYRYISKEVARNEKKDRVEKTEIRSEKNRESSLEGKERIFGRRKCIVDGFPLGRRRNGFRNWSRY